MKKSLILFSFLLNIPAFAEITHIRILFHEDPAHEATVAFTQKGSKKMESKISIGDRPGTCSFINSKALEINRTYDHQRNNWLNAIKLTKLKPNSPVYFCLKNDQETSKEYYFVTTPDDSRETFSLLFGGDSRSERDMRIRINKSIKDQFEKNPKIYALVHGGDFIWNGRDWDLFSEWLDDHMLTTTSNGRLLPLIVARGNHESSGNLFNDIFVLEGNLKDTYYMTKIGKTAIFNLNTNISAGGDQREWLEKTLKEISPKVTWLFANYHQPAYPAVKGPGPAKKFWVPIFEKYQFDLVFESDGHVLKKTLPIFDDKKDMEKGIIYVGEGGLGVKLRTPSTDRWYLQSPGYADSVYHYYQLEIEEDSVKVDVLKEGNTPYDSYDLKTRVRPL